jgi:hypothetical protein
MKITVVGAVLIVAAAIVVVLVVRALNSKNVGPEKKDQPLKAETPVKPTAKMPENKNNES